MKSYFRYLKNRSFISQFRDPEKHQKCKWIFLLLSEIAFLPKPNC